MKNLTRTAALPCPASPTSRRSTTAERAPAITTNARSVLLFLLFLCSLIFAPVAKSSQVVICYTNSSTGLRDTNDFRTIPLSNIQNADGTFNTIGLPTRWNNTNGIRTNWFVANNYLLTNSATGFWQLFRVTDSSSNVVTLGQISLGQNANPFVTLVVPTNQVPSGILTNNASGVTLSGAFTGTLNATSGNVVSNLQPNVTFASITNRGDLSFYNSANPLAGNVVTIGSDGTFYGALSSNILSGLSNSFAPITVTNRTAAQVAINNIALTNLTATFNNGLTGMVSVANNAASITVGNTNVAAPTTNAAQVNFSGTLNGIANGQVGPFLINKTPQKIFVIGDSRSVQAIRNANTNIFISWGGQTNNSIASANTRQADGSIIYNVGAISGNGTNISKWVAFTNLVAGSGIKMDLDTALCVPGMSMWNIIGGLTALQADTVSAAQGVPASSYDANGQYVWAGSLDDSGLCCYRPNALGGNNDLGFIYAGVTNYTTTNFTFAGVQRGSRPHYATITFLGTPNASMGLRVTMEQIAGSQTAYVWPYTNTANLGTNNLAPINYLALTNNAPIWTGTNALVVFDIGGNDTVMSTNTGNYLSAITNNIARAVNFALTNGYTVLVTTYPLNYNYQSYVSSGTTAQIQGTTNILKLEDWQRTLLGQVLTVDLAQSNNLAHGYNTTNYIDGTHETWTASSNNAVYIYSGLGWRWLTPPLAQTVFQWNVVNSVLMLDSTTNSLWPLAGALTLPPGSYYVDGEIYGSPSNNTTTTFIQYGFSAGFNSLTAPAMDLRLHRGTDSSFNAWVTHRGVSTNIFAPGPSVQTGGAYHTEGGFGLGQVFFISGSINVLTQGTFNVWGRGGNAFTNPTYIMPGSSIRFTKIQ